MTTFDAYTCVCSSELLDRNAGTDIATGSRKESTSFRKFPVEIRNLIYSNIIAAEGPNANAIAAFRPDVLLHAEILEVLFREHTFVISLQNCRAIASFPENVMRRVTKIDLNMQGNGIPTKEVSVFFPSNTRVLDITMNFEGSRVDINHFYGVAKQWLKYFGTVKTFRVIWTNSGPGALPSTYRDHVSHRVLPREISPPTALLGCIKVANKWLKVEGILAKGHMQINKLGNSKSVEAGKFVVYTGDANAVRELEAAPRLGPDYRDASLSDSSTSSRQLGANRSRQPEQGLADDLGQEPQADILEVEAFIWTWKASNEGVLIWNSWSLQFR